MMELFVWLEHTPIANAIRETRWMYATFETAHYIGLALLVGGIMLIDLRVLGFARTLPLKSMIGLLPFVWVGFLINVLSGSMLFIYGATSFGVNHAFWLKMTFMVLAGLNALAFDLSVRRSKTDWVGADLPPPYVRLELRWMEMLWRARQPMGLTTLPPAALALAPPVRLAWLMGRTTVEGLAPAEIF